ncbi:taste receptor type 2 member 9-like [Rhinoderma darwinii]|uniref:taste receptor type 2 member 9-like n=1 Tax=Rhinoderma darwinii TaxID=43563 RepID=UPI003F66ABE1
MTTLKEILMHFNFVTLMLSYPGNIFIITVNILDFCKNRRLPLSDRLIFGFSVFSLLHGLTKGYILHRNLFQLAMNEFDKNATHVFMYLNMCTLWFSALLSIHFCLKIVNINNWFYICLQRRSPKMFPCMIIAFLLGYFLLTLYSALEANLECLPNITSKLVFIMESPRCSWLLLIFLIICVLCAFLCSISALTILISLVKHMKRIKENTKESRTPNMDAHIRAITTVTTLLAANILIFCFLFITVFSEVKWIYLFGVLISICHIFSSYFLMKGTKKLDEALVATMKQISCFRYRNQ